ILGREPDDTSLRSPSTLTLLFDSQSLGTLTNYKFIKLVLITLVCRYWNDIIMWI
ncbi:unnamed protein product, partial [Gulo gulo]